MADLLNDISTQDIPLELNATHPPTRVNLIKLRNQIVDQYNESAIELLADLSQQLGFQPPEYTLYEYSDDQYECDVETNICFFRSPTPASCSNDSKELAARFAINYFTRFPITFFTGTQTQIPEECYINDITALQELCKLNRWKDPTFVYGKTPDGWFTCNVLINMKSRCILFEGGSEFEIEHDAEEDAAMIAFVYFTSYV